MMRIIPLPQMLHMTITAMATRAIHHFCEQELMAEPESVRPMAMIIGPVTIGGKYRITLPVPNRESRHHEIQETGAEHARAGIWQGLGCAQTGSRPHLDHGSISPDEGEGRAEEGRDLEFCDEMEEESADSGKEQGRRY